MSLVSLVNACRVEQVLAGRRRAVTRCLCSLVSCEVWQCHTVCVVRVSSGDGAALVMDWFGLGVVAALVSQQWVGSSLLQVDGAGCWVLFGGMVLQWVQSSARHCNCL